MPSQNLNQRALAEVATREGSAAFRKALTLYPTESFYAFCFYTDNDVTSVYPHAATEEGFSRICPSDDPEDRLYYRWAPAEWDLDFGQFDRPDPMLETNRMLFPREGEPSESDDSFGERKRITLVTLTECLLSIRSSGVFSGRSTKPRLAFWVNIGDAMDSEISWMLGPALPHLHADDAEELKRMFEWQVDDAG